MNPEPERSTAALPSALGEGDRYQPLELLGRRAGRRTILAQDSVTGSKVVVKLLTFGEDFHWDDLKLFEREAETLRSLTHPSIPRYLDSFEFATPTARGFAIVQSYIEARSLEVQVKAGRRFSEGDLKAIAMEVLHILQYLHGCQPAVIHRDIKPSNILLTDRSAHSVGRVYLVDFGSVQSLAAREGGTITVVGTYGYMPPEQFGGRAVPASDLYGLGAALIYLASGHNPADLPQQELRIQFESVVSLSPVFVSFLRWLTEPSLDRRASASREVLEKLQKERAWGHTGEDIEVVKTGTTKGSDQTELSPRLLDRPSWLVNEQPRNSKIEIYYGDDGYLSLRVPRHRLRLREMKDSDDVDFSSCLWAALIVGIIFSFVPLTIYIILELFDKSFILLSIIVLLLGLFFWLYIRRQHQYVELLIDDSNVQLKFPGIYSKTRIFKRSHVWQIKSLKIYTIISHEVCLSIGVNRIFIQCNVEEAFWLKKWLCYEFNLPGES